MKKLSLTVLIFTIAMFSIACKIENTKTVTDEPGQGRVVEHSVKLKETVTDHEHGPEIYHSEKREDVVDDD